AQRDAVAGFRQNHADHAVEETVFADVHMAVTRGRAATGWDDGNVQALFHLDTLAQHDSAVGREQRDVDAALSCDLALERDAIAVALDMDVEALVEPWIQFGAQLNEVAGALVHDWHVFYLLVVCMGFRALPAAIHAERVT